LEDSSSGQFDAFPPIQSTWADNQKYLGASLMGERKNSRARISAASQFSKPSQLGEAILSRPKSEFQTTSQGPAYPIVRALNTSQALF